MAERSGEQKDSFGINRDENGNEILCVLQTQKYDKILKRASDDFSQNG